MNQMKAISPLGRETGSSEKWSGKDEVPYCHIICLDEPDKADPLPFIPRTLQRSAARSPPQIRIDGKRGHVPCDSVEEGSVMFQLSMLEETGDHHQSAHWECLIDKWLLPLSKRFTPHV
jgi:hypothetical protein